jgi:PKD repeat protein
VTEQRARTAAIIILVLTGVCSCGGGGGNPQPQNQAPNASFTIDAPPGNFAPMVVDFNASGSSDADGTVVEFQWDFEGDGTFDQTSAVPTAQFSYETEGVFSPALRVTDDDGASDSSTTTLTVDALEFTATDIVPGTLIDFTSPRVAAAVVSGIPVAAFSANGGVFFVRAQNALGTAWDAPVNVTTEFSQNIRLLDVQGNPAILFVERSTGHMVYSRSPDAAGSAWPEGWRFGQVMQADSTTVIPLTFLLVNGNPGAVLTAVDLSPPFNDPTKIYYQPSDDPLGSTFSSGGFEVALGTNPAAVFVDGRVAVFFKREDSLCYMRALNDFGFEWPVDPVIVETVMGDLDGQMSAALIAGRPAISYGGDDQAFYVRASDAQGTAFEVPVQTIGGPTDRDDPLLAFIGGRPLITLHLGDLNQPGLLAGLDAAGSEFSAPITVGTAVDPDKPQLIDVGGEPALVYADDNQLMFALGS